MTECGRGKSAAKLVHALGGVRGKAWDAHTKAVSPPLWASHPPTRLCYTPNYNAWP